MVNKCLLCLHEWPPKPDSKLRGEKKRGSLSQINQPWKTTCGALFVCAYSYVSLHLCVLHLFLIIWDFTCIFWSVVEETPRTTPPPHHPFHPRGLSDIWLWMDTSYPQVIRAVKPLGAAAVHIITTLLGLCLEVRWNPIVWFRGVQICSISFYATSFPVRLPSVAD